jgi:nucleotidyltransferase AbiEii toxin of type IV toxin-antitoxin system
MAESFLSLSREEQLEALGVAATASGRPAHLLEKDVWVVWALSVLFESPFADHLVFKGGTSLSKAYHAIRRFSEDIDVTYDIRALAPELIGDAPEALPASSSQEKKWSNEIRKRLLPAWIAEYALPLVKARLELAGAPAKASADGESVYIAYDALTAGSGYVAPVVKLEFGARSTGEPADVRAVICDAAEHLPELAFPTASPRVMKVERTFWEKATAIHVYCRQHRLRGDRFARHWHDVTRLDRAGHVARALKKLELGQAVARHKRMFFAEKDRAGQSIDYFAAVGGDLQLVPAGEAREKLRLDYEGMVADGVLLDDAEPFEVVIEKCSEIQERVNAATKP